MPILAAQPDQLNFVGCGVLPAPAAQTIALVDVDVVYEAVTDAAWLGAARQPDGRLQIGVDCRSVPALWAALPVRGAVLVRATGRRPLIIEVKLTPGLRTYLPVLLRSTR